MFHKIMNKSKLVQNSKQKKCKNRGKLSSISIKEAKKIQKEIILTQKKINKMSYYYKIKGHQILTQTIKTFKE